VPGYGRMTVADLLALPDDDGYRYEVVEGVLVRVGSSVYKVTRMAGQLIATLLAFVVAHELGDVTPPDGTYDLDAPGQSITDLVLMSGLSAPSYCPSSTRIRRSPSRPIWPSRSCRTTSTDRPWASRRGATSTPARAWCGSSIRVGGRSMCGILVTRRRGR